MATSAKNRASSLAAGGNQWAAIPVPNVLRQRKRSFEVRATAKKFIDDAPPITEGDLAVSIARGTIDMSTEETRTGAAAVVANATKRRQLAVAERHSQFFETMQRNRVDADDSGADADDRVGASRALQGALMDLCADTNDLRRKADGMPPGSTERTSETAPFDASSLAATGCASLTTAPPPAAAQLPLLALASDSSGAKGRQRL